MNDLELIKKVIKLTTEERRIGVEVLELLQEIERRKSYFELGYDSLFSFCVKELRYSEAQASRRIQAMRAMHEIPELKPQIKSGALTVTTVAQVHTHLKQQAKQGVKATLEQKLELFSSMRNQSAKQVEAELQGLVGETRLIKLTLELDEELSDSWDEVKNLSAHSTRGQGTEILRMLVREWLKRNNPRTKGTNSNATTLTATSVTGEAVRQVQTPQKSTSIPQSRYIPIATRRLIWTRDQGKCTLCGSRFAIQVEHRQPFARGGAHASDNLTLLCRSCNLGRGIQKFGLKKMRRDKQQH